LGGDDYDRGYGIAVDSGGYAYVTGETVSLDFPTTPNAFQPTKGGGLSDSFVTKLNQIGTAVEYSSYLGGTGAEFPGRLALDAAGQAYVTGATASFDFPTTVGAFQTAKAPNGADAFVTKVNAAGTALVYSTYLGGAFGNDYGEGIAVDSSGQAHVTGEANSGTFPVTNAFQPVTTGRSDAFVSKLNASGSAVAYSSYLGGSLSDSGFGIAVVNNVVRAVGQTNSTGEFSTTRFPTTTGAFQPASGDVGDAYFALISGGDEPPPPPSLSIGDVSRSEGHGGTTPFTFTVSLSAASSQAVTVSYATANGAAGSGDYQSSTGALIIPAGQITGSVVVLVNGDRLGEKNETFFVNLSGASNATIDDGQGVGTILDDEPRITIGNVTRREGATGVTTLFVFTVKLSAAYDQPVTVWFKTSDGAATSADNDYTAQTAKLTFQPGETTKTVAIQVRGDKNREANETFYVDLFRKSSNALFTRKRGIGTIVNDD
jgi:hypothetical protein